MPEIVQITAEPYSVRLRGALTWGQGHRLDSLEHVLVTVTLSGGAQGTAEATPRPTIYGDTQGSTLHIINQHLAPLIIGQTLTCVADIDALEPRLHMIRANNTAKGALNMALYGALAQSQHTSLQSLLGVTQTHIPVSYIVGTGSSDTVYADVNAAYMAGVRMFKLKIGKSPTEELRTLESLQTALPAAHFYADANQCLTQTTAGPLLSQMAEMGVSYCEEPLPVDQVLERQALRAQTPLPLIGDDSCFAVGDVSRELALNTVDIINIKTARTGFSQSRAIANLAASAGKGIMVGSQASSLIGCLHAALFAGSVSAGYPAECTFYLKTEGDLSAAPMINDGQMLLPNL